MSGSPLRLSVLIPGRPSLDVTCDIVCSAEYEGFVELWLKCSSMLELLSSIRSVASSSALLALGGVDGSVYRFLPQNSNDLVKSATNVHTLQPGSTIVVQHCRGEVHSLVKALEAHASKITLKRGSTRARVVLAKPLDTAWLFDRGIRLLGPITAPPILFKPSKRKPKTPSADTS